ncbi:MAG: hypothetical protein MUE51_14975, partial [Thermoleophilia bacterium]|nr:hypothetical protein [Thermoleophilia bacterium]
QDLAVIAITGHAVRVAAFVVTHHVVHPVQTAAAPTESALDAACRFLKTALAGGPRGASEVTAEARAAGMSTITIRRAREHLGVRVTPRGPASVWELPR